MHFSLTPHDRAPSPGQQRRSRQGTGGVTIHIIWRDAIITLWGVGAQRDDETQLGSLG